MNTERTPVTHELKTWPPYYGEIAMGRKTFEARLNDRDFRMLDILRLREFDPAAYDASYQKSMAEGWGKEASHAGALTAAYTGRECERMIGYMLFGGDPAVVGMEAAHAGISQGYVVLSLVSTPQESAHKRAMAHKTLLANRERDGLPRLGVGLSVTGRATK